MSLQAKTLIHCSASRISLLRMSPGQNGTVRIESFSTEDLVYDLSRDELWLDAVTGSLEPLLSARKLSGEPPVVIVPGFRVLTKNLRAPHVEPDRRWEMVALEAQRSLPYALDEVSWSWQVLADDGIETELQFLAVKRDWLDLFLGKLDDLGIRPSVLAPESLLDANCWRWMHRGEPGPVLIVNIGARSTNVTLTGDGVFAVRTINLGGNLLTQALAEPLGLSFEQAEAWKIRFNSEPEVEGESEGRTRLFLGEAESFLKRLNAELTRSIMNFRRQTGAGAPAKLLLAGGGALLRGLPESLAAKQKLRVDWLYRPECVTLAPGVDAASWNALSSQMTEALGEAVRDDLENPSGVDLLPESQRRRWAGRKRGPAFLVAAALLLAAAWMPLLHFRSHLKFWQGQVRELQPMVNSRESMAAQVVALREEVEALERTLQKLDRPLASRTNWILFFQELQERLHGLGDVWLDELQLSRRTVLVPPPPDSEPKYDDFGNLIPPRPVERTVYRMNLNGNLLLRQKSNGGESPVTGDYDETLITQRIRSLIRQFGEIDFVMETGVPTIFWTRLEDGVLPFSFNLTVNPERPL